MGKFRNKIQKKRGTVIIAFAYFVVLVLLPLLAIGYDFAMLHVFKMHLDNIAQLSALSCQPHANNEFNPEKCAAAMAQVASLNLEIKDVQNLRGTPWQFDSTNKTDPLKTSISSKPNMQTSVFSLSNEKFFELQRGAKDYVKQLTITAKQHKQPSATLVNNFFSFTKASNRSKKTVSNFSIMGYYKPLFVKYLNKKYERIPVKSSEITVRAVTCPPGGGC